MHITATLDGMTITIAPQSESAEGFAGELARGEGELASIIKGATHVEVFTGAGMSADSGLDTFRDATTGIWSNVDPQAMASLSTWARDPEPMLAWYLWRGTLCEQASPNAGHRAIGRWQTGLRETGRELHVTTQNIDNLHERGGAKGVSHLHGSLFAYRCSICGKPAKTPPLPDQQIERVTPPQCSLCGNPVRPGVVWFGESLPEKDWSAAEESMRAADLVVIVGTSGVVWPAAGLPEVAKRHGAIVVEVSPARTELTALADWSLRTTAAIGVPALVELAGGVSAKISP